MNLGRIEQTRRDCNHMLYISCWSMLMLLTYCTET